MIGVSGLDPGPWLDRKQVVFTHQPRHALVIHHQAAPACTSARSSNRLAATSLTALGRRCRLASAAVRLASSRYLLQGTFEKIHLQRALRQKLLQLPILFLKPRRSSRDRRNRAMHPHLPPIQQAPRHIQFLGQSRNVVATLHPRHRKAPELLRVNPLPSHLQPPHSLQTVSFSNVSLLGVTPTACLQGTPLLRVRRHPPMQLHPVGDQRRRLRQFMQRGR